MITKGDDYPIHQTPVPVAYTGTDRNFYDRYWFNGYHRDGSLFFGVAMGVYPAVDLMDAGFSVSYGDMQYNVRASKVMNMERLDLDVGPIRIEVVEPLKTLRIIVDDAENGVRADLTFSMRCAPIEEPRTTLQVRARVLQDYTRMTQAGNYEGYIEVKGERIEVSPEDFFGTRDRSWGVRGVGETDRQPVLPPRPYQYFWLWSPLHFDDSSTLYAINEYGDGTAWNRCGTISELGSADAQHVDIVRPEVEYRPGTRQVKSAVLHFVENTGDVIDVEVECHRSFLMSGIGYTHPEWGHGYYHGDLVTAFDEIDLTSVDYSIFHHSHVQHFVTATLKDASVTKRGFGALEQFIMGEHVPSGLEPQPRGD